MPRPNKVKPAPVPFPNGGGLKAVGQKNARRQQLEREALDKKHEIERVKLEEKHGKENSAGRRKS
jgi:hypothetical protein